jgi:nitric oxide dioxygenase
MLSTKTIELIKSTVPVLEKYGETITKRFYHLLFTNHPELLNIFNNANQKQGRQQTALANAVYAAAAHIDQLDVILPVVKQIAHKHRSLGIKPEHYPIVGNNLLTAIKDVLGDAATEEIIDAWAEAYNAIANVFIQVEAQMYEETEDAIGGWKDFREFVVYKKVKESNVITSFYLKPVDAKGIASYLPGQYISVKVNVPGEKNTQIRQYSLSDASGNEYYRISVKREEEMNGRPAGVVSNYLHNDVYEGDILDISAPAGDFVLDVDKSTPVVLISGGVGLTPMLSMLNTLAKEMPDRKTTFIHAAINSNFHALKQEVEQITEQRQNIKNFTCYDSPTTEDRQENNFDKEGYVTLDWLKEVVDTKQSDFYFCGPLPFMKAVYHALKQWGIDDENIHYEFFGPASQLVEEKEAAYA